MNEHTKPESLGRSVAALEHAVRRRRPTLARILDQHGNTSVGDYAQTFADENGSLDETIQPQEGAIQVISDYAEKMLGNGKEVEHRLRLSRAVLTANHMGPDYLNITVQGNLVFGLGEDPQDEMPIFAGGCVPLNNLSYGRGLFTARGQRVNIFGKKDVERMVTATPAFTEKMVDAAIALLRENAISEAEASAMITVLNDDYKNPEVLRRKSYSDQSVLINRGIWNRLFTPEARDQMPNMTFLEMEKIVTSLLREDLPKPGTYIHEAMFNPKLRASMLRSLNGVYGCWDLQKLDTLLNPDLKGNDRRKVMAGASSVFVVGIDNKGRRVPMALVDKDTKDYRRALDENVPSSCLVLRGLDDSGNAKEIPYTPEAILQELDAKKALPGLVTCYSELAFAYGFRCYGGFMQADYLTNMRNGSVEALKALGFYKRAQKVARIPTENYATGMSLVVARYNDDGSVKPAGAIEIMAHGGLTTDDLLKMRTIKVREANLLGLPGMYRVIYREEERDPLLLAITEEQIAGMLGQKLVEIKLQ